MASSLGHSGPPQLERALTGDPVLFHCSSEPVFRFRAQPARAGDPGMQDPVAPQLTSGSIRKTDRDMDDDGQLVDSAVLIIDVINDFAFPGGDDLVRQMPPVVDAIDALRCRADALQRPVIYINDNFGRWRSSFAQVIEWCRRQGGRGAAIAERLSPRESDYFVLKPGQSGFYQTPLPALLEHLKVSALVLTGVAGDQCVLATAMDAHIRDYRLWVPADATASLTPKRNQRALDHISEVLGGSVARGTSQGD